MICVLLLMIQIFYTIRVIVTFSYLKQSYNFMLQIALTKALEQAARQYRKEKFLLQLSEENLPKDVLKPRYKSMWKYFVLKIF